MHRLTVQLLHIYSDAGVHVGLTIHDCIRSAGAAEAPPAAAVALAVMQDHSGGTFRP
jgi:hypothetical protein